MEYAKCATCGESVYRYDGPPGPMGNDGQDCWHVHYSADHDDGHLPKWPADDEITTHIDLTTAEIHAWHGALESAITTGKVDPIMLRNMLAEVRNAASAAGVEIEPTLLRGL